MSNYCILKNEDGQEIPGAFLVWKAWGETLAELLKRFRSEQGFDRTIKITYAGRLDPAAEGLVLLLSGDVIHQKENYLKLDKTYLLTVLFGIETDTGDLLGIPVNSKNRRIFQSLGRRAQPDIKNFSVFSDIKKFIGKITLPYPNYSSKPVNGKPLFMYARAEEKVDLPTKEVEIKNIKFIEQYTITAEEILKKVQHLTKTVQGDFRQTQIQEIWEQVLQENKKEFQLVTLRVQVTSGTYMRSLAVAIGEKYNLPACAYVIVREKISDFHLY